MHAPFALLVLLLGLSAAFQSVSARECVGDVMIQSVSDIAEWEDCTRITGSLQLFNSTTVASLDSLSQLKRIEKDLYLWKNTALTSLSLPQLEFIGGQLDVLSNPLLQSFLGLNNLRTVNGHIKAWSNDGLKSMEGLDSLMAVGGIEILDNPSLVSIRGLLSPSVRLLSGPLIIQGNAALKSLIGLDPIELIRGDLRISNNAALTSLEGLSKLRVVEGKVMIEENASLINYAPLTALQRIGSPYPSTPAGTPRNSHSSPSAPPPGSVLVGPLLPNVRCIPAILLAHADPTRLQVADRVSSVGSGMESLITCERLAARFREAGYPNNMRDILAEMRLEKYAEKFEERGVHLEQLLDMFHRRSVPEHSDRDGPIDPDYLPPSFSSTHTPDLIESRIRSLLSDESDRQRMRAWVNTQNRWLQSEAGAEHAVQAAQEARMQASAAAAMAAKKYHQQAETTHVPGTVKEEL